MDYKTARTLLDKYWNCETSLEEEEQLRSYFQQDDIADDLRKYQDLFRFYSGEISSDLNEEFDKKILKKLGPGYKSSHQRYLSWMYKAAAAVLLILSFFVIHERFIRVKEQAKKVVEDTFSTPEKALEETKRVLFFVSEKINKGKEGAAKLNKFKKAEDVVKNANYKEI